MKLMLWYQPEGADKREWDLTPKKMSNGEAEMIEEITDWTFVQWQNKALAGSIKAARAALFTMLSRTSPDLQYGQVEFAVGEVGFELVDEPDDEPTDQPNGKPEAPASAEGNG